jgi:uncharacterized protein with HEPN domain
MSDDDNLYRNINRLKHMLESAHEAVQFADGMTVKRLEDDRLRALALTRCMEIIGEAATSITAQFRAEHTEIPWRLIIARRLIACAQSSLC